MMISLGQETHLKGSIIELKFFQRFPQLLKPIDKYNVSYNYTVTEKNTTQYKGKIQY
jgi:hypothetical protein